ncbi:MAG TPA: hypothetical protein VNI54_17800 [Thermoanaerobaculia bacterium]|nr:hypothetical protein [Thermoanaerobaculia bacterium]
MVRFLAVAVLLTTTLTAQPIGKVHVIPTAPTNLTPVVLTFEGKPVSAPGVRIEGSRIEVRFPLFDGPTPPQRRQDTVLLGNLPAGNYQVVVIRGDRTPTVLQEFPLQVRDVTTIPIIFPWIVNRSLSAVTEWKSSGFLPGEIRVGGQPAFVGSWEQYFSFLPRANLPPGLHDVEVVWPDGKSDVAKNAVEVLSSGTYSTFGARLLVPVLVTGRVADGTTWSSELDVELLDWGYIARSLDRNDGAAGLFVTLSPRYERRRTYHVRVQPDPPRGNITPIPVVSETEFRPSMRINDVPTRRGQRVTLRIYSVEPANITVTAADGELSRQVRTTGGDLTHPAFASVDLTGVIGADMADLVLFADAPIWAMASTFDLATRELYIRTP